MNNKGIVMENKEWKSSKQILNELKEENSELKKQTTSQKQTIERLRELLKASRCPECDGSGTAVYSVDHIGEIDEIGPCQFCHEKNDALKNTGPKTEDELIEEKTDRNANIISSFMEHCKQNGFIIPDSWFESYFNA